VVILEEEDGVVEAAAGESHVVEPALTGLDAVGHGLPPPPLWRRGMSDSTWKRTLRTLVRPTLRVRRDRRYPVETPRPAGEKPEGKHRLPLYPSRSFASATAARVRSATHGS